MHLRCFVVYFSFDSGLPKLRKTKRGPIHTCVAFLFFLTPAAGIHHARALPSRPLS